MGFQIEVNSILRTDEAYELSRGGEHPFRKSGSRVYFDDIPIWLCRNDWTALAEIRITAQSRTPQEVAGTFRVLHVCTPAESEMLTVVFRRMFAGGTDPYIYLLMNPADYAYALQRGVWDPPSRAVDGFIHASPAEQLSRVANKHYAHLAEVVVVLLQHERLTSEIRWEPATGGLYPHIYGPINMSAAAGHLTFARNEAGTFDIRLK